MDHSSLILRKHSNIHQGYCYFSLIPLPTFQHSVHSFWPAAFIFNVGFYPFIVRNSDIYFLEVIEILGKTQSFSSDSRKSYEAAVSTHLLPVSSGLIVKRSNLTPKPLFGIEIFCGSPGLRDASSCRCLHTL